jgi:hypothetical protein
LRHFPLCFLSRYFFTRRCRYRTRPELNQLSGLESPMARQTVFPLSHGRDFRSDHSRGEFATG